MHAYERLSGLDEAFLAFETPVAYMHIAATAIFDAAPLRAASGGIDVQRIRQHVATRLPRLPRFRQRLRFIPVTRDAIWIDDEGFDLACHVRHVSLPRPGTEEQLRERVASILERPLNRMRPLWELWIVEGLADDRFALIAKVHHCIVDGIAGVGVLANLLSPEPGDSSDPVDDWTPRPIPTDRELVRDELARRARGALAVGRTLANTVANPLTGANRLGATAAGMWRLAKHGLTVGPATCFNRPIGPYRRVSWLALDLERLRGARRRLGGTLNDVVLACVAGALRTLFARHRNLPVGGTVRAAVPVSVRTPDDAAVPGNRVSAWIVPLPLYERDPRGRVAAVHAVTEELKRRNDAAGAAVLTHAADWTGAALLSWAVRLVGSASIYDLIITNVPGPRVPLYLLGARMVAAYPHLPLFENQGLGIALLSYCDRLYVGLTAEWAVGALVAELACDLAAAVEELATAAAAPSEARAPAPTAPRNAPARSLRPRFRTLGVQR